MDKDNNSEQLQLPDFENEKGSESEIRELKKSVYEAFKSEQKHYKSSAESLARMNEPLGLDIVIEPKKDQ